MATTKKLFEVQYDDPETGKRVKTEMWFDDTPTVSAKEWAEDYAYAKADKGWQREYQPGAGQHLRHPTYGQLRAMPVERRPSAKRNPPDRQGDRNAFEQP